ncbi:MAG: hypothetical protein MI743_09360 [Sneathiellales bacterium]|nr:hypothetical protein [Sneathiellales bacterium]
MSSQSDALKIEPYILIPAAAAAVFLMVMFIRFMTGKKDMVLSDQIIKRYFADEEMGVPLKLVTLGAEGRYALVWLSTSSPLRMLRSFGHKIVQQELRYQDLVFDKNRPTKVCINSQDVAHSRVSFEISESDLHALQKLGRES